MSGLAENHRSARVQQMERLCAVLTWAPIFYHRRGFAFISAFAPPARSTVRFEGSGPGVRSESQEQARLIHPDTREIRRKRTEGSRRHANPAGPVNPLSAVVSRVYWSGEGTRYAVSGRRNAKPLRCRLSTFPVTLKRSRQHAIRPQCGVFGGH